MLVRRSAGVGGGAVVGAAGQAEECGRPFNVSSSGRVKAETVAAASM